MWIFILLAILVIFFVYKERFINNTWAIVQDYPDPISAHWDINKTFTDGWTPYDIMLSPFPIFRKPVKNDPPQFQNLNSLDTNLINQI